MQACPSILRPLISSIMIFFFYDKKQNSRHFLTSLYMVSYC